MRRPALSGLPVSSVAEVGELELAVGDLGDRVLGRQHLALLGHLQPRADGAGRQRPDRAVGGTAAAADGAAAAVEEQQADAVSARPRRSGPAPCTPPRPRPCSRRPCWSPVADHHLLLVADRPQRLPVHGHRQQPGDRLRPAASVAPASSSGTIRSCAPLPPASQGPPPSSAAAPRAGPRAPRCRTRCRSGRVPVGAGQRLAQHPEGLDRLPRRRREVLDVGGTSGRRSAI